MRRLGLARPGAASVGRCPKPPDLRSATGRGAHARAAAAAAYPQWPSSRCAGEAIVCRGLSWGSSGSGPGLVAEPQSHHIAPVIATGPQRYNRPIDALWTRPYVPPPIGPPRLGARVLDDLH